MIDYLVIGGGPAGAAAAIVLAEAGASVHLVGRQRTQREQFGESLSPGCAGLLRQLGLWPSFCADSHLPCHVHRSAWVSDELDHHDLILDPRGHGWHIDRALFEQRMIERAQSLGVSVSAGHLADDWSRSDDHWSGCLRHDPTPIRARQIIDASGKAAWFARRQGVQRIVRTRQIALIATLQTSVDSGDTSSLVETVPEGWWYSAPTPGQRLAVSLFTDAHDIDTIRERDGFARLLAESRHTRDRVEALGAHVVEPPRFVDAGSGQLARVFGPGWLAVGDAAMNYEPLSAHGITLALRSAIDGARALLANSPHACSAYAQRLTQAYEAYEAQCQRFYHAQTRWPDAPFWARRARPARTGDAAQRTG